MYIDVTSHLVPSVSDINVQQVANHVIYLYNQLTGTSDQCNFKQNYVLRESAT